jgi:hypothetical protein
LDTGDKWLRDSVSDLDESGILMLPIIGNREVSVGTLRNIANSYAEADILIHWDSDDWSHPNRIAEQVALLEVADADVVGYDRMLFWREILYEDGRPESVKLGEAWPYTGAVLGTSLCYWCEAWLYTGAVLGTSLCYWRETWEQVPFQARGHHAEDLGFVMDVQGRKGVVVSVSAQDSEPRMIARIHRGNAANPAYSNMEAHPQHWQRVPKWDKYCQEAMQK